ncbi:hypothetical protein TanjilG_31548 [Lupinus angustifolius]|uniref:Uncharacterized protein n=1 Tax=Lupinus angustifolius TaxID=3871 RepID=A0A4P1RTX4_LUPAN|nr:PREDICTED: uncharacterized protein LOC109356826 [Lupinus angustifolius]OIW18408.1 hypothetical protein TanjilG_31548 [Lupinus angustifolius]
MAGIVSGISYLAVGTCDARRRQTQPQSNPEHTNTPAPCTPPMPPEENQLNNYCNSGRQTIKGLTNQTGFVKGNANGTINFGNLTASAGVRRQT